MFGVRVFGFRARALGFRRFRAPGLRIYGYFKYLVLLGIKKLSIFPLTAVGSRFTSAISAMIVEVFVSGSRIRDYSSNRQPPHE